MVGGLIGRPDNTYFASLGILSVFTVVDFADGGVKAVKLSRLAGTPSAVRQQIFRIVKWFSDVDLRRRPRQ